MDEKKELVKDYIKKYEKKNKKDSRKTYEQLKFVNDVISSFFILLEGTSTKDLSSAVFSKKISVYVTEVLKNKEKVQLIYEIRLQKSGVRMFFKCDCKTWIVAIISEKEIKLNSKFILSGDYIFFAEDKEGFSKDATFANYSENHFNFATIFSSNYEFYTFCYLLNEFLLTSSKNGK